MLGYNCHPLVFPLINPDVERCLEGQKKPAMIFKIAWEPRDEKIQEFNMPATSFVSPTDMWFQEKIDNLRFVLSREDLDAIHRFSRMANDLYVDSYRGEAMKASYDAVNSLVLAAMRVLQDCVYDPETNFFMRKPEKNYLQNILAWRFWIGQTGEGCIYTKINMRKLEDPNQMMDNRVFEWGQKVLEIFRRAEEYWQKEREIWERQQGLPIGPVTGPALGGEPEANARS